MPASSFQQQKLRVCEVCSAYLGLHDNDRRLADHFGGKLHLGFIQIREKLDQLKVRTVWSQTVDLHLLLTPQIQGLGLGLALTLVSGLGLANPNPNTDTWAAATRLYLSSLGPLTAFLLSHYLTSIFNLYRMFCRVWFFWNRCSGARGKENPLNQMFLF